MQNLMVFTSREPCSALLGASGALGPLLGRSWTFWGPPWADPGSLPWGSLGPLLGRPWASPGLSWAVLGASRASPGLPLGAPGPLLAAKVNISRNLVKPTGFPLFLQVLGGSGEPPGGSWGLWVDPDQAPPLPYEMETSAAGARCFCGPICFGSARKSEGHPSSCPLNKAMATVFLLRRR